MKSLSDALKRLINTKAVANGQADMFGAGRRAEQIEPASPVPAAGNYWVERETLGLA